MLKSGRRTLVVASVATAMTVGMAGAGVAAFADTTVSPTIAVPAPSGGGCFEVVVFTATFNSSGQPQSVTAGSVTFNKPILSCV
jgi:hypothetical protein